MLDLGQFVSDNVYLRFLVRLSLLLIFSLRKPQYSGLFQASFRGLFLLPFACMLSLPSTTFTLLTGAPLKFSSLPKLVGT